MSGRLAGICRLLAAGALLMGGGAQAAWAAPLSERWSAQSLQDDRLSQRRAALAAQLPTLPAPQLARLGASARLDCAMLLADEPSAHGLGLLWVLAFDPDAEVQAMALRSAVMRCRQESSELCAARLAFFVDAGPGGGSQVADEARTALVVRDPQAALAAASREYKLDLISLMAGKLGQPMPWAGLWPVLLALAEDQDTEVQDAANHILMDVGR